MSTIKADTIVAADGSSPVTLTKQEAAKAWVGSLDGDAVAVDSFNFSSFVDNGTGDNTCNFSNSMANAGYSSVTSCEDQINPLNRLAVPYNKSTSLFKIESYIADSANSSNANQNGLITGDLA